MEIIKIHDLPEGAELLESHELPVSTGSGAGAIKRFSLAILKAWIIAFVTPLISAIPQGPAGAHGVPGAKGIQGAPGAQGAPGNIGIQGGKGDRGPAGPVGIQGPVGAKGEKGDIGATGVQGVTGQAGAPGADGATGIGLADGGTTGQFLTKASDADFDTEWNTVDLSFSGIAGQPSDNAALNATLGLKVDKVDGYDLSQENYTTAEKDKLANLSEHFKGNYTTLAALSTANPVGVSGDYAFVDAGAGSDSKMYIWDSNDAYWVLSSGSGIIPDATENASGLVELATLAEALARTDDARAMTALKTIALILDEKKNVYYQIAPVSLNEVSFLMRMAGNVTAITISGASNAKLKTGAGTYPVGAQTFPFAYAAGDRVFVTYNYTDLTNASCNIILTCRDN